MPARNKRLARLNEMPGFFGKNGKGLPTAFSRNVGRKRGCPHHGVPCFFLNAVTFSGFFCCLVSARSKIGCKIASSSGVKMLQSIPAGADPVTGMVYFTLIY